MTERSDDASGTDPGQGRAPGPAWTEADTGSRTHENRSGRRRDQDDSRDSRDSRGSREAQGGHGIGHSLLMFLKEVVIVVVLAVVLSLVLKTWFVQSFWIPSGSMNATSASRSRRTKFSHPAALAWLPENAMPSLVIIPAKSNTVRMSCGG